MTGSTRDLLFPVVELRLEKEPVNEKMTTNKEMAVMMQFLDFSSVSFWKSLV